MSESVHSDSPAAALEAAFTRIAATRMAGVPILHPGLEVAAVGFRPWRGEWIGVLITPWFMNLLCLPGPDSDWQALPSGSGQTRELPVGMVDFLAAHEDRMGPYLSRSLCSPMGGFRDMDETRAVAETILGELFRAPQAAIPPRPPEGLTARMERPVSRRGFLGGFLREAPDA